MTVDEAFALIREDTQYSTIRIQEPDLFAFKSLPLLQFIMPTFGPKTLIRENRNLGLDKAARPEISLKQFWAMSDAETTHNQLDVLQKRNCHFSHAKLRTIFQQRK